MAIKIDAEFYVCVGLLEYVNELADFQLAAIIQQKASDIRQTNADRRLKPATRTKRIADANKIREACIAELASRMTQQHQWRCLSVFLARFGAKNTNVYPFPGGSV